MRSCFQFRRGLTLSSLTTELAHDSGTPRIAWVLLSLPPTNLLLHVLLPDSGSAWKPPQPRRVVACIEMYFVTALTTTSRHQHHPQPRQSAAATNDNHTA